MRALATRLTGNSGRVGNRLATAGAGLDDARREFAVSLADIARPQVLSTFGSEAVPFTDSAVTGYLQGIAHRVWAQSHKAHDAPQLHVVDSPVSNAASLPNGEVYLSTGMFVRLGSEAQAAKLLAHEREHVDQLHGVEAVLVAMGLDWAQWVLGALSPISIRSIAREAALGIAAEAARATLGRHHEYQADAGAIVQAHAAGYDVRAGADFFDVVPDTGITHRWGPRTRAALGVFDTHPQSDLRKGRILDIIDARGLSGGEVGAERMKEAQAQYFAIRGGLAKPFAW